MKEPETRAKIADLGGMAPGLTPDGGTSPAAFETYNQGRDRQMDRGGPQVRGDRGMSGLGRRGLLATGALLAAPAIAQEGFPNRPIRLVIPFTPAGTTDLTGRLGAEQLGRRLGQPVVVENRAGAGGNVGAEYVARAEPDGYTLLLTTIGTGAINFAVYGDKMPYKPADLAAVGLFIRVPNVLMVPPEVAVRDVAGLVAQANARRGGLNYGTAGIGSSPHVCMELFGLMTGAALTHVPYRGSAPMITELMAGRVDAGMDNIPSSLPFIKDGKLRAMPPPARRGARCCPTCRPWTRRG